MSSPRTSTTMFSTTTRSRRKPSGRRQCLSNGPQCRTAFTTVTHGVAPDILGLYMDWGLALRVTNG